MTRPQPGRSLLMMLVLLLLLVACGDVGAPSDARGQPHLGAACAAGEHALPDGRCAPAGLPPDMACPPGERALDDGRCQPAGVPLEACAAGRFVPDGGGGCKPILPEAACPPGQMAVPGESACREVSPCGEGPWDEAIPDEPTTEYVDAAYQGSDSDGSRQRPWKTAREGVQAASAGAIVALAAGQYPGGVIVRDRPVRLWGLCPARTVVLGLGMRSGAIILSGEGASGSEVRRLAVTGPRAGVVVVRARAVVLGELWVHDAGGPGIFADVGADVAVRGALIEQNFELGVFVTGSEATIEATTVRATQPNGDGVLGRGIDVEADPATGQGGKLSLTASVVEQNHEVGVFVSGSEATIETTAVRATQSNGAGRDAAGIAVRGDREVGKRGKLLLTASTVEQSHGQGITVAGSEATVEATVVRATQPNGDGRSGWGIVVQGDREMGERGELLLTASIVDQSHGRGIAVTGSEATVEATVVRATQPNGDGESGWGITVQAEPVTGERGKLLLTASTVEQNHGRGIAVTDSDATVDTTVVRATQPDGVREPGYGITVLRDAVTGERANLQLTASVVEQNYETGVLVVGSDATVEATVVRATQPNGDGEFGRGISVQVHPATGERGKLLLTASVVEQNHDVGVSVEGSEATVEATLVRATQPNGAGEGGRGINVQADLKTSQRGTLLLTGSVVEQNHDVGVFVASSEATVEATAVRGTKRSPAGQPFGDGILVVDGLGESHTALAATESTDNARAGVMYVGSTGELSAVRSSGNQYGLVLQPGQSGAQPMLGEGNVFEDNTEQDELAGGDLPVPDAAPQLP